MKKVIILLVVMVCLVGCSNQSNHLNQVMKMRETLNHSKGCQFTVDITADYGNTVYGFSMDCKWENTGILTFTVTNPDSISGISGTISQDSSNLTFDGKALAFQPIADGYITPVTAPWLFVKTLAGGYIASVSKDDSLLHILAQDSYANESMEMDIWLSDKNIPVGAEMVWKGKRILTLNVKNFTYL